MVITLCTCNEAPGGVGQPDIIKVTEPTACSMLRVLLLVTPFTPTCQARQGSSTDLRRKRQAIRLAERLSLSKPPTANSNKSTALARSLASRYPIEE